MKKLLVLCGHSLLAAAGLMAAGVAVAPTQVQQSMQVESAIEVYRDASMNDWFESPVVTMGDTPMQTPSPLTTQVAVKLQARQEDFDWYKPVRPARQRYNRKRARAQRNGWHC